MLNCKRNESNQISMGVYLYTSITHSRETGLQAMQKPLFMYLGFNYH